MRRGSCACVGSIGSFAIDSREFPEWGLPLIDSLNEMPFECKVFAKHATEHRIGLKVCGQGLSDEITGTDPLKDNFKLRQAKAKSGSQAAQATAGIINRLSEAIHENLSKHPINQERAARGLPTANIVLLRGCGQKIGIPLTMEMCNPSERSTGCEER